LRRRAAVLTVSDGVVAGSREDVSGDVAAAELSKLGFSIAFRSAVPDEVPRIQEEVRRWVESGSVDLVLSTGGTGLGPRDVTPEAIRALLDREIPGYGELLRSSGLAHTPMAVLSRSLAGNIGSVWWWPSGSPRQCLQDRGLALGTLSSRRQRYRAHLVVVASQGGRICRRTTVPGSFVLVAAGADTSASRVSAAGHLVVRGAVLRPAR
jgi:molybdenum cofactor synthesis domain-containing protein